MVPRSEKAPSFDGRGPRFLDCYSQVHLWMRTTRTEAPARASVLILHMQPAPLQVCLAGGSDILGRNGSASKILGILRNWSAPEAAGSVRQQVMRFKRFKRPGQSLGEYIAEYDLRLRKAESGMEMGAGHPGNFVSILRMANAALPRHE